MCIWNCFGCVLCCVCCWVFWRLRLSVIVVFYFVLVLVSFFWILIFNNRGLLYFENMFIDCCIYFINDVWKCFWRINIMGKWFCRVSVRRLDDGRLRYVWYNFFVFVFWVLVEGWVLRVSFVYVCWWNKCIFFFGLFL